VSCIAITEAADPELASLEPSQQSPDALALPTLACIHALERLLPRCPTALLLSEMAKGRLMDGIRRSFLSTSTDLRRGVVALLVALHTATASTGAFSRYAEAYLSLPQQKLLSIYISKKEEGE
jgi:hypothetical protein